MGATNKNRVETWLVVVTVEEDEIEDCDPYNRTSWLEPRTRVWIEPGECHDEQVLITYHADGDVTVESEEDGQEFEWVRKEKRRG